MLLFRENTVNEETSSMNFLFNMYSVHVNNLMCPHTENIILREYSTFLFNFEKYINIIKWAANPPPTATFRTTL